MIMKEFHEKHDSEYRFNKKENHSHDK